jgi:hypothetical protein
VLAAHYGFTDEELDFIPSTKLRARSPLARLKGGNYDIKYRMGRDAASEEDELRGCNRVAQHLLKNSSKNATTPRDIADSLT